MVAPLDERTREVGLGASREQGPYGNSGSDRIAERVRELVADAPLLARREAKQRLTYTVHNVVAELSEQPARRGVAAAGLEHARPTREDNEQAPGHGTLDRQRPVETST